MPEPQIVMGLTSVDAAKVVDEETGQVTILLSEHQSTDSALSAVRTLLPNLHPDARERLVLDAMPEAVGMYDAPQMDRVLRSDLPVVRRDPLARPSHRREVRTTGAIAVAAVLAAGAAGWLTHEVLERRSVAAFEQQAARLGDNVKQAIYESGVQCEEDGNLLTLSCTDVDGTVMAGEVIYNEHQAAYHLFHGTRQTLVIRAFARADQAQAWARRSGTPIYRPLQVGRMVVAGTEPARTHRWARIISSEVGSPVVTYDDDGVRQLASSPP